MVGFAPSSKPVTLSFFKERCQIRSELLQFRGAAAPSLEQDHGTAGVPFLNGLVGENPSPAFGHGAHRSAAKG